MRNTKEFLSWIIKTARKHGGEAAEVVFTKHRALLKRIHYGDIHQNPAGESYAVNLGIIKKGRYLSDSFTDITPASIEKRIAQMMARVRYLPEAMELPALVPKNAISVANLNTSGFDKETAELKSKNATRVLVTLKELLEKEKIVFSGKMVMGENETWFANSNGVILSQKSSGAILTCYGWRDPYQKPETSSYAASGGTSYQEIEVKRVAEEIIRKHHLQKGKKRLLIVKPGEEAHFDVILEPYALAPMMGFLGSFSFNGLNYLRGISVFSGKLNEEVTGKNFSLFDDPLSYAPQPFDFEGYPRNKTALIEQGVLRGLATDSTLARLLKQEHTAHALPPTARFSGAAPSHIVMEISGKAISLEEMVETADAPTIWITKTHYIHMPHFQTAEMTGTTQHGVFLIDRGKINPIYNLRFKQKMFEAFSRIESAGPVTRTYDAWDEGGFAPFFLPTLKIKNFKFLGGTSLEK